MKIALGIFAFALLVVFPIIMVYYLSKPVKRWYPNIKIKPPLKKINERIKNE